MVCLNLLDQHLTRSVSNSAKLFDIFFFFCFTLQPWSRNTHCHHDCLSCFYFTLCPSLSPDTRFPWAFIRNTPDSPASIHSPDAPETTGGINCGRSVRVWKVKPVQQCLLFQWRAQGVDSTGCQKEKWRYVSAWEKEPTSHFKQCHPW